MRSSSRNNCNSRGRSVVSLWLCWQSCCCDVAVKKNHFFLIKILGSLLLVLHIFENIFIEQEKGVRIG